MKKVILDEALKNRRTLVFHYVGKPVSLADEHDNLWYRLQKLEAFYWVAAVDATTPEEAFRLTQDWEGGRSTSPGDLVRTPDGTWWFCLPLGWCDVTSFRLRLRRSA